jgi:hypothetical protein
VSHHLSGLPKDDRAEQPRLEKWIFFQLLKAKRKHIDIFTGPAFWWPKRELAGSSVRIPLQKEAQKFR